MNLSSENFDICRSCLFEPETNRSFSFYSIFSCNIGSYSLYELCKTFLGIDVQKNDNKPKIICEDCFQFLENLCERRKKAAEAAIVIRYLEYKKFSVPGNNQSVNKPQHLEPINDSRLLAVPHSSTSSQIVTEVIDSYGDCQEVPNQINSISSGSEHNDDVYVEDKNNELRYCSICQMKCLPRHVCYHYNKELSTCLIPNCVVIARSLKDIIYHYRQHSGLTAGQKLCLDCFKENKRSEQCIKTGQHNCTFHVISYKCYSCDLCMGNMQELAYHKLEKHNGRLMNSSGNYLCLYCEKTSPALSLINKHLKNCTITQNMGLEITENVETESFADNLKVTNKKIKYNVKSKKMPLTHTLLFFTCLKPSCNIILLNFDAFKKHHRQHFKIGNKVMCWQCFHDFNSVADLRAHQVGYSCRTPGMFQCYECSEAYDDMQSLSIHKYTVHNGRLAINYPRKFASCPICRIEIDINNLRNHLISHSNKMNTSTKNKNNGSNINYNYKKNTKVSNSKCIERKKKVVFKCSVCGKLCLTAPGLVSHYKTHERKQVKNKVINEHLLAYTNNSEEMVTATSSIFHNNVTTESIDDINIDNNISNDDDELDTSSSTPQTKEMCTLLDNNLFEYIDGNFCCINCPKKFGSKRRLKEHWTSCRMIGKKAFLDKPTKKNLPKNYYCTKCKEYYSSKNFGAHWNLFHGQKLVYNSFNRFSCKKCPFKFIYEIALEMHCQHVHHDETIMVGSEPVSLDASNAKDSMENCNNMLEEVNTTALSHPSHVELIENVNDECVDRIDNDINEQTDEQGKVNTNALSDHSYAELQENIKDEYDYEIDDSITKQTDEQGHYFFN